MTRGVGVGKETVYGTGVNPTRWLESIGKPDPDQGWIIPKPVASRSYRKKNLGPYRARGPIGEFEVEPENIGELLLGIFGSVTSVQQGGTIAWLHSFTIADTIPSWTVRMLVEQCDRILPGCLEDSLTIKFAHDKDVMAVAEMVTGFIESRGTASTPTISSLQAFNMYDATAILTIGGVSKRNLVYDLEVTIKNNIPTKGDLSGRGFPKKVGERLVTGRLSAVFDDFTEYDRFLAGTEADLEIRAVGPIIVGAYPYYLDLTLENIVYLRESAPAVTPQNEPLIINAPFQAFYDSGVSAEIRAWLQNRITGY